MAIGASGLVAAVVVVIPIFLMRKTKHLRSKAKACGEKYIDISPVFFWSGYLLGSLLSIVGIYGYLFTDEAWASIGLLGMGFIFTLASVALQGFDTSVNWTSEYICGAKSGLRFKKNTIFWDDIILFKTLPNNTFQLQDKLGNSVHWSVYQTGWYEIIEHLRRIRPDIDTSDYA